jgi:hypothetical protein
LSRVYFWGSPAGSRYFADRGPRRGRDAGVRCHCVPVHTGKSMLEAHLRPFFGRSVFFRVHPSLRTARLIVAIGTLTSRFSSHGARGGAPGWRRRWRPAVPTGRSSSAVTGGALAGNGLVRARCERSATAARTLRRQPARRFRELAHRRLWTARRPPRVRRSSSGASWRPRLDPVGQAPSKIGGIAYASRNPRGPGASDGRSNPHSYCSKRPRLFRPPRLPTS